MVAQENSSRADALLLGNLLHALVLEQRAARAAERAVRHDLDALALAEVDEVVLGQGRVVLDLVRGGHDLGLGEELLEVDPAVVAHAHGLRLARLDQAFHLLPRGDVVMVPGHVALPVGQLGEAVVVAVRVHPDGPVDQVQVDVVEPEELEGLVEADLGAGRVRVPQLGHDKDVLALHGARRDGRLDALADLVLVAVAVGRVDEAVAGLKGDLDGGGDFAGAGLPGACVMRGGLA